MKRVAFICFFVLMCWGKTNHLFAQVLENNDTLVKDTDTALFVLENNYAQKYPFIDYEHNFIEWNNCDAIFHFFNALENVENKKVRILHIGDSHVQTDFYTGNLRNAMQELFGYGGRGFVFPYKSAGTHAAYDYSTLSSGEWDFSRNVSREVKYDIGIAGATIFTTDTNASFTILFRSKYRSIRNDFTHLRIYCKTDSASFGVNLVVGNTEPIKIPINEAKTKGFVDVILPKTSDTLVFSFYRLDSTQVRFECSGLSIESCQDKGLLYSSVGINGAGFKSVLRQTLFEPQIRIYNPDLVILDLGANDFYPFKYNEQELTNNLTQIIQNIKKWVPNSSIILMSSHDLWYRKKNVPFTKNFAQLLRKIAQVNSCAFFDYYHISGGEKALNEWRKLALAQPDRVHLTYKGYQLKSEILYNALLTSYREFLTTNPESLLAENFSSEISNEEEGTTDSLMQAIPGNQPKSILSGVTTNNPIEFHLVKREETISLIANKYGISNNDIKLWNNLRSTKLFVGQKIRVAPPKSIENSKTISTYKRTNNSKKAILHKVRKGETISALSKKYKVSEFQIKKLNNLKGDVIKVGEKLKIQ